MPVQIRLNRHFARSTEQRHENRPDEKMTRTKGPPSALRGGIRRDVRKTLQDLRDLRPSRGDRAFRAKVAVINRRAACSEALPLSAFRTPSDIATH